MNARGNNIQLVNGRLSASVAVTDRGLTYGDGLFETVRFVSDFMPLWPFHWQRLQRGAQVLGLTLDEGAISQQVSLAQLHGRRAGIERGVMKLIVTRGAGGRGYIPPPASQSTVITTINDLPTPLRQPFALKTCRYRLSHNPVLAGLKHLNRLEHVLAANSVALGANEEGLVLDCQGHVVETLHHNLFIVSDGKLLTPNLHNCGVAGTLRDAILTYFAPKLGLEVQFVDLDSTTLARADEVFICNAVRGITPVAQWENVTWPNAPLAQKLAREIAREWDDFYDG